MVHKNRDLSIIQSSIDHPHSLRVEPFSSDLWRYFQNFRQSTPSSMSIATNHWLLCKSVRLRRSSERDLGSVLSQVERYQSFDSSHFFDLQYGIRLQNEYVLLFILKLWGGMMKKLVDRTCTRLFYDALEKGIKKISRFEESKTYQQGVVYAFGSPSSWRQSCSSSETSLRIKVTLLTTQLWMARTFIFSVIHSNAIHWTLSLEILNGHRY